MTVRHLGQGGGGGNIIQKTGFSGSGRFGELHVAVLLWRSSFFTQQTGRLDQDSRSFTRPRDISGYRHLKVQAHEVF